MKINKWVASGIIACMSFGFLFTTPTDMGANAQGVTPEQFGANGFDNKVDTVALQKALDSGKEVILKENAKYIVDKTLVATKNLTMKSGTKKATIISTSNKSLLVFRNPNKANAIITHNISRGSNYVVSNNTKNIKIGDIIELKSNKLWHWDNRGYLTKGELHTVHRIEGNKVYLTSKTDDNYFINKGEKVTVKTYSPKKVHLQNIKFTYSKPTTTTLMTIDPTINSYFSRVDIINSKLAGIKLTKGINARVSNSYFKLATTKDVNSGYGFQDYGGRGNQIINSTFTKVRRGVDFSGDIPSRYGVVRDSRAYGPDKGVLANGNSGFGTHSTAEYILFENNYIENFDFSVVSRGNHITFKNNKSTGSSIAFLHTTYGDNVRLTNNKYISKNGSKLEWFVLKSNSFKGQVTGSGNTGVYYKFKNR